MKIELEHLGQLLDNPKSYQLRVLEHAQAFFEYEARSWDSQVAHKFVMQLDDGACIECMGIYHYSSGELSDFTVEVSNMRGCPIGCVLCASGSVPGAPRVLDAETYIRQFNTVTDNLGIEPDRIERLFVSFAGIGDPSISCGQVDACMTVLRSRQPHVRFNIATCGANLDAFGLWRRQGSGIRTLQIPYFGAVPIDVIAKGMAAIDANYSFERVFELAVADYGMIEDCRVKVNYVLLAGLNDRDDDAEQLADVICAHDCDSAVVKLSLLNEKRQSKRFGLKPCRPERIGQIRAILSNRGVSAYAFGSKKTLAGFGCGQLVGELAEHA